MRAPSLRSILGLGVFYIIRRYVLNWQFFTLSGDTSFNIWSGGGLYDNLPEMKLLHNSVVFIKKSLQKYEGKICQKLV